MRFIIELDGPVFDIATAYYRAHCDVAAELGWSRLDRATFWRRVRKDGPQANLLPGARPVKLSAYQSRFQEHLESDDLVELYEPHADIDVTLPNLGRRGSFCLITLGTNLAARRSAIERAGLTSLFSQFEALDPDPRRRPGELRNLADGDGRTLVAATSETVIRAAGAADLVPVGLTCGACSSARLFQAGAGVVYRNLEDLESSLGSGAEDLIRAGLLPWAAS